MIIKCRSGIKDRVVMAVADNLVVTKCQLKVVGSFILHQVSGCTNHPPGEGVPNRGGPGNLVPRCKRHLQSCKRRLQRSKTCLQRRQSRLRHHQRCLQRKLLAMSQTPVCGGPGFPKDLLFTRVTQVLCWSDPWPSLKVLCAASHL